MEPYRPSLLVLTDGQPFDPTLLARLAEDFRTSMYFHAPTETDEKRYEALRRDLSLLCDTIDIPFIEDSLAGPAWDEHARAGHSAGDDASPDPDFAQIDHFVGYAQTEGFDFYTTVMPFNSPTEEQRSRELFREAADIHGIRYIEDVAQKEYD